MEPFTNPPGPAHRPLGLWVCSYLIVLLYALTFGSFIVRHRALPYFDEAAYISKVYRISDAIHHTDSIFALLNPTTYLSVEPRQDPPFMMFLAAVILGGKAHPTSIALLWLGIRLLALMLAMHLLAELMKNCCFVVPALLVILGGLPALLLQPGMYMMDVNFEFFGLLTFSLVLWDHRRHTIWTATASALSTIVLILIKPTALAFVFPMYCVLGAYIGALFVRSIIRRERADPDAPHENALEGILQYLGWVVPYVLLGFIFLWLWKSPYGAAVVREFQVGTRGYWRWNLSCDQLFYWSRIAFPPWLLALVLVKGVVSRGQSVRTWVAAYGITALAWWLFFNFRLVYSVEARVVFAISPIVVASAVILLCREKWWTIAVTSLAGIFFILSAGRVVGFFELPRVERFASWVAPLGYRQTPVKEEVGLFQLAKDIKGILDQDATAPSSKEVMVAVQDDFVDPMGLELALRYVNNDSWFSARILGAPYASFDFDLMEVLKVKWFVTKEKRKTIQLPEDIFTSLYALDSLITDSRSPLHSFFEKKLQDPVKQPDLLDTVTLWHLREAPPLRAVVEAMLWVKPQFQNTPGASAHQQRIDRLIRAIVLGTSVDIIDRATAETIIRSTDAPLRNIKFGDQFLLLGVVLHHDQEGLTIELAWEALKDENLDYVNFIHLLSSAGRVVGQADYPQDFLQGEIKKGVQWRDVIHLSNEQLAGARRIGLGIYHPSNPPLIIDHGPEDTDGHRLIIPVHE
ncbi:MAG: hypothetical protein ACHQKY_04530 [Terriglobia bacterium]